MEQEKRKDKKDMPVVDAAGSSLETVLDVGFAESVLAPIPILGLAIKLLKARDSVSDALLARKVGAFAQGLNVSNEQEAAKMRARLESATDREHVGEVLINSINQASELEKAKLLGMLFKHYLDGRLDGPNLRRLAQAVTTAFFDDLQHFITSKTPDDDVLQPLAAHGLTTLDIDEQFDSSGYHFRATSTGKLLRELFDNLRDDKAFNALLSH